MTVRLGWWPRSGRVRCITRRARTDPVRLVSHGWLDAAPRSQVGMAAGHLVRYVVFDPVLWRSPFAGAACGPGRGYTGLFLDQEGVRVISMIQLDLMIPTVLVACSVMAAVWRSAQMRSVLVLVAVLLLIEQINDYPVFNIDRPAENAFLAQMDHIPPSCRVFFAQSSRPGPDLNTWFRHNVDSMIPRKSLASQRSMAFRRFCHRAGIVHPEGGEYLSGVREWLASQAVTGPVCAVDFRTGAWTNFSE